MSTETFWMTRSGEVREFSVADYSPTSLSNKGWTPCDPPQPVVIPVETRRQLCISSLHVFRDTIQNSQFLFRDKPIQCRQEDVPNIIGMLLKHVLMQTPLPENFAWRCADDTWLPLDVQGISDLATAYYAFKNACYQFCWFTLEPAINASDNPESIDITQGWPT